MNEILDKYRGCLLGGAVGDALGYAVEFMQDYQIFQQYGEHGITEYSLVKGIAQISDDTQMTLYTANGLLAAGNDADFKELLECIAYAFRDWFLTQEYTFREKAPFVSWLNNVPEMFSRRAPGNTCISFLAYNNLGSITNPRNNSKGCGGVMRVAPIGLFFSSGEMPIEKIDLLSAETAALTHGHELGYIPAAMFVHIIHLISRDNTIVLLNAVQDAKDKMQCLFSDKVHLKKLLCLIDEAIQLSEEDMDDLDAIRQLGRGWAAEETLAIAIYCALKYSNDFEKAIVASVNHSGDSDSTGAVTGNLLGAYLGASSIPQKFLDNLELKSVIMELADDLYYRAFVQENEIFSTQVWRDKYSTHRYNGSCYESSK